MSESIAAIATAYGQGSIAIVRVSGERAYELGLKLSQKKLLKPRYAHLSKIYTHKGEIIDEAIFLYFKAPFSFTGEDVLEIQTHGGLSVATLVLDELLHYGVRLANAGEFSKRACLNGKMDLLKALNIADLINAKSSESAKLIARNLDGKLGTLLQTIKSELVKNLAFVETSIDYADDDLPSDLLENIASQCKQNAEKLGQIVQISRSKKALVNGFKIALVGKPNVGKSSLLNALLAHNRAIVSNQAGTTRDLIEEDLKIGSHLVRIIDTAGIRSTDDELEQMGIALSKKSLEEADIILALFDNAREFDNEDKALFELLKPYLKEQDEVKKIFLLLNKSDLEAKFQAPKEFDFLKISANNDISILLQALEKHLNSVSVPEFLISNLELINSCEKASLALQRAGKLIKEQSLELFAFELNLALKELNLYIGELDQNEVFDAMFSSFCLGK